MTAPLAALALLSATLLPARAATALPLQGPDQQPVPPIQDLGDSYLITLDETGDGSFTLAQFVKICQEMTGINFTYSKETAQMLEQSTVLLYGQKEVPKGEFYSFFQILMIINNFVCAEIGPEHLSVVVIQSLDSGARSTVRQNATYVSPENLDEYADQPATLITTVLDLPNTDVRTLANSMRTLVVDPNTLTFIPVTTNSLVLQGFGSQIAALAQMLRLVDEVGKPEDMPLPEFEVIPLEYAAAEEISDQVEELLDASRRAQQGQARQPAQGATAPLQQQATETKILVSPRMNALLVMAMPDQMPRIKELIARLDTDIVERERNYHFVSLKNADASEMADVLENFLQDASRVQSAQGAVAPQGQRGGAASGSSEVAVVPDPTTNSLLISASRTRYEEVRELIERLDQRQDQVLIETALIELTGRNVLDLGIELGGAAFDPDTGPFGLSNFGLSTVADSDGDGIPDVKVPTTAQGVTAGLLSGDDFNLPILLQALETRQDTNVLNIPSVLVTNNSSARVLTLDEQPTTQIITNPSATGAQTQESFQGYQEAGITLQISPAISASRYLRLAITLEVSNFLGTFQGAIPPPRITRTIETSVNVPDGYTMVIGGIIVDNASKTTNQVPILGNLPLLGQLFRRDTDTQDRTTLYFFVTPHIMHDEEFADLAEYSYSRKLEAADTIGTSRVRMVDPRFGDRGQENQFGEGFDVPLYLPPDAGPVDPEEIGIDPQEARKMLSGETGEQP